MSDDEAEARSCVEEIQYHLRKLREYGYTWYIETVEQEKFTGTVPRHTIVFSDFFGDELARIKEE